MGSFFARPQSFSCFSFLAQRKRTMRFMLKWNNPLCFHPPTSEEKSLPTFVFLTPTRSSCTLWIQYSIVSHMQSRKLFTFFDDSLFFIKKKKKIVDFTSLDIFGCLGHFWYAEESVQGEIKLQWKKKSAVTPPSIFNCCKELEKRCLKVFLLLQVLLLLTWHKDVRHSAVNCVRQKVAFGAQLTLENRGNYNAGIEAR